MALYNSERTLQKAQLYGKDGIYRSPRPSLSVPNDPNFSVIPFLFRNFPSIAHLPALIDAKTAETLTFSDLKTHVFGLSNALLNLNVSKNDVVLILLPNSILYPVAFFLALAIGAIATTANPQYSVAEVTKQVKDSNPKLIFTNHNLYDKVKGFDLPCIMLNTPETNCWRASSKSGLYYYSDLIELYSGELSDAKLPPIMHTDAAAILYTSGTSGTSKGAVLTHRNLIASALMITCDQEAYGTSKNIFPCFLPISHMYGLLCLVFSQIQRGDTVVVMAQYDIDKMLLAVEKYDKASVGYWKNDKATKEIIDDEGWLHTGDLGYFDDDGQLYIVDRVKELIKYKGFQVAPLELEDLLLTHLEVADSAVIGIPDAEAGEVSIAFVVQTSLSSITSEEIKEFIAEQDAHFKRLRGVIFTDVIPKSPSEKILKEELRQNFETELLTYAVFSLLFSYQTIRDAHVVVHHNSPTGQLK